MNSPTKMNGHKPRLPIGETTLLYPLRLQLGGVIPGSSVTGITDAMERMIERTEPEAGKLMRRFSAGVPIEQSYGYALAVGRLDATPESRRRSYSRLMYFAGVEFVDTSTHDVVWSSFEGIPEADVEKISWMLTEVASHNVEYGLTCLNDSLTNASIEDNSRGLPLP